MVNIGRKASGTDGSRVQRCVALHSGRTFKFC